MTYSEGLGDKHDSNISPEILSRLDSLGAQIDPAFAFNLEKYRSGVISLLKANPEYANHPIVIKALEQQNSRLLKVLSINYLQKKISGATMQAANDDMEMLKAA